MPLHYAADYGQTTVLNYLLDKGADPNVSVYIQDNIFVLTNMYYLINLKYIIFQMLDKHGISVLLAAIWEGHTDCVKTLLKNVSTIVDVTFCKIIKDDLQF